MKLSPMSVVMMVLSSLFLCSCNMKGSETSMLNQPNKIEETPPVFESVSATNPSMDSLIRQLDYIKGHPEIKHANFGFSLFSLDSNRIIVDHNGNISMTPASILTIGLNRQPATGK